MLNYSDAKSPERLDCYLSPERKTCDADNNANSILLCRSAKLKNEKFHFLKAETQKKGKVIYAKNANSSSLFEESF